MSGHLQRCTFCRRLALRPIIPAEARRRPTERLTRRGIRTNGDGIDCGAGRVLSSSALDERSRLTGGRRAPPAAAARDESRPGTWRSSRAWRSAGRGALNATLTVSCALRLPAPAIGGGIYEPRIAPPIVELPPLRSPPSRAASWSHPAKASRHGSRPRGGAPLSITCAPRTRDPRATGRHVFGGGRPTAGARRKPTPRRGGDKAVVARVAESGFRSERPRPGESPVCDP